MTSASLWALAALLAVLAGYVWRARVDHPTNRAFAVFALTLAGWVTGIAGLQFGSAAEAASRLTFTCASLMPPALLFFVRNYPTPSPSQRRLAQIVSLLFGATFAVMAIATPLIVHDVTLSPTGPARKAGPLYPAFAVYFLIGCVVPLIIFLRRRQHARGQARAQLQHLGAGLTILFTGGATANLLVPLVTGVSSYSWVGPYFVLPLVALVAHAIIRHRLLDLRLVIHRSVALLLIMVTTALVLITLGRLASTQWRTAPLLSVLDLTATVAACLAVLAHPVYRTINRLIDSYLYRGHTDHAMALQQATNSLSRLMTPDDLAQELKALTTTLLWPESFAMVVVHTDGSPCEILIRDDRVDPAILATLSTHVADLAPDHEPRVLLMSPQERRLSPQIANTFRTAGIDVLLVLARRQSVGFALLGPRRSGDAYFAKDLSFLESLAQFASVSLDNAMLHRQRVQMLEYSARLLESLNSAVVAVDRSGKVTNHNSAAAALFSLPTPATGSSLDVLPTEVAAALTRSLHESPRGREFETVIEHPSRGPVPIILSSTIVRTESNDASGAIAVATDISAVKELERNQRRLAHLSTMARFYAGIAHEIRSPLSSISNFTAMLSDRYDDPEFRDTAARLLPAEVGRIVRLADKLRLMAPGEDGALAPVDLGALLSDIVMLHEPAAREHQVVLQFASDALPTVSGDPGQLVQLFTNLLNNAIEAMPTGGVVEIEARRPENNGDSTVSVAVLDRGAGINPSIQGKIFEPFFTTKAAGTGLGLSICKEIADFHRARLTLTPRLGGGTIACVELPIFGTSHEQLNIGVADHSPEQR